MRSTSISVAIGDTARRVPDAPLSGLGPRLVSVLAMGPIALAAILAGPPIFASLVALAAVILAWEWTLLCGEGRFGFTGGVLATLMLAVVLVAAIGRPDMALGMCLAGAAVIYGVARTGGRVNPEWNALGPLYIGLPVVALVWLRAQDVAGRHIVVWLLFTVWATDTGAYFAGRLIGGLRLAPVVSPNKTWAGLIGGVGCAALVGLGTALLDARAPRLALLIAAGAVLALVAQAGDLGESWVKRRFGVKDTSRLIPGHGGLFDRVDGLLAAGGALALWQWATGGSILAWR